jgi:hypothetical protein
MKKLINSTSSMLDCHMYSVRVEDYAPFKALEVDHMRVFQLENGELEYLIISLANGYVLCFNLYANAISQRS